MYEREPIDRWEGEDEEERTRGAWERMISRCEEPDDPHYGSYGGMGLTVCDRWKDFDAFVDDMGYCPPGYSLERDELDLGYEPGNCRWIPYKDQMLNTRAARRERDLWNRR